MGNRGILIMAGDWIKVRSNIKDDPDVVLMAGNLNIDEFAVVGRLHAVWAWLDQHSSTGFSSIGTPPRLGVMSSGVTVRSMISKHFR